jgi:hypothetical protein
MIASGLLMTRLKGAQQFSLVMKFIAYPKSKLGGIFCNESRSG